MLNRSLRWIGGTIAALAALAALYAVMWIRQEIPSGDERNAIYGTIYVFGGLAICGLGAALWLWADKRLYPHQPTSAAEPTGPIDPPPGDRYTTTVALGAAVLGGFDSSSGSSDG